MLQITGKVTDKTRWLIENAQQRILQNSQPIEFHI